jgi:hypothetical protein
MKLIINSNINYKKPLSKMLESLIASGFSRFEDVVVVIGECGSDDEPRKIKISEISNLSCDEEVIVVRMKLNNFDYTGYHALHVHSQHPLLISEWYMYTLDTVTFTDRFLTFLVKSNPSSEEILIPQSPHSNICAFGSGVIKNYGDNFGVELDKNEAIRLEFDKSISKNVKSISNFGKITRVLSRTPAGQYDIYETGFPRKAFYYPEFGLNKWIFWGGCGDITGNVSENKTFEDIPP